MSFYTIPVNNTIDTSDACQKVFITLMHSTQQSQSSLKSKHQSSSVEGIQESQKSPNFQFKKPADNLGGSVKSLLQTNLNASTESLERVMIVGKFLSGFKRFHQLYFNPENELFGRLKELQSPKTLIIGCCDSRVDPAICIYILICIHNLFDSN